MKKLRALLLMFLFAPVCVAQWNYSCPTCSSIFSYADVVIGTSSPANLAKLTIKGNIDFSEGAIGTVHPYSFGHNGQSMSHFGMKWVNDSWNSNGLTTWLSGKGGVKLFTEGKSRLAVHNNGNVGIGTDNPMQKLSVNGNIHIPYNNYLLLGPENNGSRVQLSLLHDGEKGIINYYYQLQFKMVGGSKKSVIVLDKEEKIGIGIDNPSEKLDVDGNIKLSGGLKSKDDIIIGTNAAGAGNYGAKLRFGNVGENYDEIYMARYNVAQDKSELRVNVGDDNNDKFTVGRRFHNQTDFTHMFTVVTNGNVGIGVYDPVNKLEVDGVIRAKEVKIETGWADFVFEPDYRLPSLVDVEHHIKNNKHLPGIPTESEVKENGVNLGEMQVKLLQKIEELTLYIIQQDKEIKELKEMMQHIHK